MKKLKIGLFGASGRMGQEITVLVEASDCATLLCGLSRKDSVDEKTAKKVDIWIDFSTPENLTQVLKIAVANKTGLVCGTTGLTSAQMKKLTEASKKIPILWSSNMSMGVAILSEALKVFSKASQFDFQLEEIHHNKKKDSPSGTAVTLQRNLEQVIGKKLPPALSIRGGGVFGVHKIFAISDDEMITFEHTALNRRVFAQGAIHAALWLSHKKAGFYSMSDCLFG